MKREEGDRVGWRGGREGKKIRKVEEKHFKPCHMVCTQVMHYTL